MSRRMTPRITNFIRALTGASRPAQGVAPPPSAVDPASRVAGPSPEIAKQADEVRTQKARIAELEAKLRTFRSGWVPCLIPVKELIALPECIVCGAGSERRFVYPYPSTHERFSSLYVLGCGACGVSWVPRGALDLDEYYASTYARENRNDRAEPPASYFANVESKKGYYDRARRQAEYTRLLGRPVKTVLDLGSGPGYFLYVLDRLQPGIEQRYAVEPDLASHKYLKHLGAKVVVLDEVESLHPIDIVLSSHSLEHYWLEQLPGVLRSVGRSLAEDGLFVFEVPSADLLRTNWHYIHEPHTTFFSRDAVDLLLRSAGFCSVALIPLYDKRFPVRKDAVFHPTKYPELEATGGIVGVASRVANDPRVAELEKFSPLRTVKRDAL